jgi:hypothetical protein
MITFRQSMLRGSRTVVALFLQRRPEFRYLRDDLVGACNLGMIESLPFYKGGCGVLLSDYIRSACLQSLLRFIESERPHIPKGDPNKGKQVLRLAFESCRDDIDQCLLSMLLSGKPIDEIAVDLCLSVPVVERRKEELGARIFSNE